MTEKEYIQFIIESSDDDFITAESLFNGKRYHHCLFFCHLVIEKLLKGLIYKNTSQHAPPIHDLISLLLKSKIPFSTEIKEQLEEITTWNIRARYDDIKKVFFKKADDKFTTKWFHIIKQLRIWLKEQY